MGLELGLLGCWGVMVRDRVSCKVRFRVIGSWGDRHNIRDRVLDVSGWWIVVSS
jgi:hypothetical protein